MKHLLFFCLVLFAAHAQAQDLTLPVKILTEAYPETDTFVGTDAFGWRYTISDNEFRKAKDGKVVKFQALSLGDIFRADIQNPLQIVLFYRKFNTVVLLDNQLNETSRITFSELQEPVVAEAASLASQNRLWLYDVNRQQIGLFETSRASFKAITPPFNDPVKYYHSDYNYFYWIDTRNNCYRVNLFGKVDFLGQLPDHQQVQLASADAAILYKGNAIVLYSLATQSQKQLLAVDKSFRGFHYAAQILSIFTGNEITQYKVILPK